MTEQGVQNVQANHASQGEAAAADAASKQMDQATAINSATPPSAPTNDIDARVFNKESKSDAAPEPTIEAPGEKYAGKYDSVGDLENGYLNLQKKIGSFAGAPDEYTFDNVNTEDAKLKINADDEGIKSFIALAKENNASQEFVDACLNIYRNAVMSQIDAANKDYKSLGAEADKKLAELNAFAKNNLGEEGYARYKRFANSEIKEADLLLLMDDIRSAAMPVEGPATFAPHSSPAPVDTIKQLKQEIQNNPDKYFDSNDSRFRDRISQQLKQAYDRLHAQERS